MVRTTLALAPTPSHSPNSATANGTGGGEEGSGGGGDVPGDRSPDFGGFDEDEDEDDEEVTGFGRDFEGEEGETKHPDVDIARFGDSMFFPQDAPLHPILC